MAQNKNPFDDLRITPQDVRRSINWYSNQIKRIQDLQGRVDRTVRNQGQSQIQIGGLYLFRYDPKYKNELPYYDVMPLVFPFAPAPDGFLGLNLHYLPYGYRFKLMGSLLDLVQNVADPKSRAKVSWNILNSSARFPGVAPCVKHYLNNHVRSNFYQIPNDQWLAAAMMPLEQFKGASKQTVFADSRRMI